MAIVEIDLFEYKICEQGLILTGVIVKLQNTGSLRYFLFLPTVPNNIR